MRTLRSIERDHAIRRKVSETLRAYAARLLTQRKRKEGHLAHLTRVLSTVLDTHQGQKEEEVLIPWVVRHGVKFHWAPLDGCRDAHCHERYLISVLDQAAQRGESNWTEEETRKVAATANALAELEERVVSREARDLLPYILKSFAESELETLDRELTVFDRSVGASESEREAAAVARELGVAFFPLEPANDPQLELMGAWRQAP